MLDMIPKNIITYACTYQPSQRYNIANLGDRLAFRVGVSRDSQGAGCYRGN